MVVPVLNEEQNVHELYRRVGFVLKSVDEFELIFVNDGSTDRTPDLLRELNAADPRVKAITFTRNFGHQAAVSAGLRAAAGDAVIVMDGDLQDSPESLLAFVERWRMGYDVVYAVRASREASCLKRLAYKVFYRLLARISSVEISLDSGDFSLMDRRVVNVLNAMPERARFVRGMRSWAGFRQTGLPIDRGPRFAGEAKYTYGRLVRLAFDGFFAMSYRPLQLASLFGIIVSLVAFVLAVLLVFLKLIHGIPLQGWTSLIVALLFLGGVQLISLGILGEYVGRVYDEVRGRPSYLIGEVVGETRLEPITSERSKAR